MNKTVTNRNDYSRLPMLLAMLLLLVTFPLIWVGGLVTTYDAGMAVPDWPGTYGYNLFLYPWKTWLFGPFDLLIEHGHRLLGSLAGVVTIALVGVTFWKDRRKSARIAAFAALGLVILQGALGGARVLMDARHVAMIHGCVGPAFFAFSAAVCVLLSRFWNHTPDLEITAKRANFIQMTSISLLVLAYLQLVLGAMLRHVSPAASFLSFQTVVTFHVLVAIFLVGYSLFFASWMLIRRMPWSLTIGPVVVSLLVLLQFALGSGTWVVEYAMPRFVDGVLGSIDATLGTGLSLWASQFVIEANGLSQSLVVTGHVANGSLILATTAWTATRHVRCFTVLRQQDKLLAERTQPATVSQNSVSQNLVSHNSAPSTFSTPNRELAT